MGYHSILYIFISFFFIKGQSKFSPKLPDLCCKVCSALISQNNLLFSRLLANSSPCLEASVSLVTRIGHSPLFKEIPVGEAICYSERNHNQNSPMHCLSCFYQLKVETFEIRRTYVCTYVLRFQDLLKILPIWFFLQKYQRAF